MYNIVNSHTYIIYFFFRLENYKYTLEIFNIIFTQLQVLLCRFFKVLIVIIIYFKK